MGLRAFYTALFYAATPFIVARLFWRGLGNPAYRKRITERFGHYGSTPPLNGSIWIHAVSVGEVESSIPLVRSLRARHPHIPLILTTTTPTGSDRVRSLFGNEITHCYLPYDLPCPIKRFLGHFRPRTAVILETEIWPNLITACRQASIPLLLVNGRLSERSVRGYRRFPGFIGSTLSMISLIATQTEEDAKRFVAIGAPPEKVSPYGNIKFDLDLPDSFVDAGREERKRLFGNRPTLLAASTHEGEELQILQALSHLYLQHPDLLLILVPRHPERFQRVASLCRDKGFSTVLRSEQRPCTPRDQVFVLDRMGELKSLYAASDVAFVGGSLVPVGGHNVLEAAAAGIPVIFGPHVHNFTEICDGLSRAGGALRCNDLSELIEAAGALLDDHQRRTAIGKSGRAFIATNRGAVDRIAAVIDRYLDSTAECSAVTPPASDSSANGAGRPIK